MTTLTNNPTDLSHGVLSNLRLGNSGDGSIDEKHLPKIMVYINDGLTKLYGKFALRRKSMVITVAAGDSEFNLRSGASDFLKVIGVERYSADGQYHKVPLNDSTASSATVESTYPGVANQVLEGVFTPAIDILQVPVDTQESTTYKVHYQARHSTLVVGDLGSKEIDLPDVLYEALTMYIAYRAYMGLNTQEAIATASAYLSQFKIACDEVTSVDTVAQSQSNTNTRFQINGWN